MEKFKKGFFSVLPYLIILLIVVLIKQFIFTNVRVYGVSMEDTLHDKDIMILDKIGMKIKGIKRFDIVVIQTENERIIKRVIGLPGEIVEYKDDKLYINGKEVKDKYGSKFTADIRKIALDDDEYYVLGDNRTNSVDSRMLGPIKKNKILGHAKLVIFPFNHFGFK